MGCSSFSDFFFTKEELSADRTENATAGIKADTLTKDHPKAKEWIETIRCAIEECGITLLDTAPWYGHGTSEMVVGWALEDLLVSDNNNNSNNTVVVVREDLCINTKVGRYEADPSKQFDFSRAATLESAQRSLRRLFPSQQQGSFIDVLQLHDPEFSPSLGILLNETIPAMVECRSNGWCKALGLTGYPLEVQHQILQDSLERYGSETSKRIWDQSLTYGHFNLHDSSLVDRRVSPSCESFSSFCHQNGMGVLVAAPLSMGLLTNNPPPDWHPSNGSELARACSEAARVCRSLDVDIVDLALLYSMSHPALSCTILGMKNTEQVRQAAVIARRFAMVDWTIPGLTQELVLSFVLSVPERKAYLILSDRESGPFAGVWKRETTEDYDGNGIYAPRFQWDGIREAHEFWKNAKGSFDDWQKKSFE